MPETTRTGARQFKGVAADEFIADHFWEESPKEGNGFWCCGTGPFGHMCTRPRGHGGMHVSIHRTAGYSSRNNGAPVDTWFTEGVG